MVPLGRRSCIKIFMTLLILSWTWKMGKCEFNVFRLSIKLEALYYITGFRDLGYLFKKLTEYRIFEGGVSRKLRLSFHRVQVLFRYE